MARATTARLPASAPPEGVGPAPVTASCGNGVLEASAPPRGASRRRLTRVRSVA